MQKEFYWANNVQHNAEWLPKVKQKIFLEDVKYLNHRFNQPKYKNVKIYVRLNGLIAPDTLRVIHRYKNSTIAINQSYQPGDKEMHITIDVPSNIMKKLKELFS